MRTLITSLLVAIGVVAFFSAPVSLLQASRVPQDRNQRGAGGQPQGGFVEERGGFDISGPYEVDPNWPKKTWPAPGYIWGSQGGVFPESADRVFLVSRGEIELPKDLKLGPNFPGNWGALNRGGATGEVPVFRNTILVVDRQGSLIESWKQWDSLFEGGRGPHQVYVQPYDPERHVWIVDDMNHVIHKFTNDGKTKVFTLGEMGVFGPNDDLQHFNRPTMIDWLPDGTFFVSDGYANSRVVKFNKDGKPLLWWGSMQPGKGDGEFTVPHGIAVGDDRHVYVSDRFNRRIQVFDENGVFLDKWPSGYCHSLSMSRDQHLWCYDGDHEQFVKFDLRGHIETVFGRYGTYPGATWGVHQISADSEGNLYAAEVFGGRTQKFVPKPNANPHDLFFGRELASKTPVTRVSTLFAQDPAFVATGTGPGTYSSRAWRTFARPDTRDRDPASHVASALTGGRRYSTDVSTRYTLEQYRNAGSILGSRALESPFSSYSSLLAEVGVLGCTLLIGMYGFAALHAGRMTFASMRSRLPDDALPTLLLAATVAFFLLLQMAVLDNWLEVTRVTVPAWILLAVGTKEFDARRVEGSALGAGF